MAILQGPDLRGVLYHGDREDKPTIWPEGFDPEAAGEILIHEN